MKCVICGETLSKQKSWCDVCGCSQDVREPDMTAIHEAFKIIDGYPGMFNVITWLDQQLSVQTGLLRISGPRPEESGVLGDYQKIAQRQKRKSTFRKRQRVLKVRAIFAAPEDGYYEDVLPEDWAVEDQQVRSFTSRIGLFKIAALIVAWIISVLLIAEAFTL